MFITVYCYYCVKTVLNYQFEVRLSRCSAETSICKRQFSVIYINISDYYKIVLKESFYILIIVLSFFIQKLLI